MHPLRTVYLKVPILLLLCLIFSLLLPIIPVLDGAGIHVRGLAGIFWRPIIGFGFALLLLFRAFRIFRSEHSRISRFAPMAFQIVAIVLVYGLNLGKRVEQWNFHSRFSQRMEVVRMVESGSISTGKKGPCDCFYTQLPSGFRSLSAGGEILVSRHSQGFSVTFFVARWGMFPDDDYTAFVYRTGFGWPQTEVDDAYRCLHIEQLRPNWFFVLHS